MYRADQRMGWRVFSLTYQRKGVFALGGLPSAEDLKESKAMQVTMLKFAEFCVGDSPERARIICRREYDRRRREANKSGGGGGYSGLLKVLREKHWETND